MNEVTIGIIGLSTVLVLFLTGIELAFAMAIVGFIGFSYLVSFSAGMNLLAKDFFDAFTSYGFTVIPLFVLMGQIAFNAGFEGSVVVERVKKEKAGIGFNAQTLEYTDMFKAGIVDPLKVTRSALQNAASIAAVSPAR